MSEHYCPECGHEHLSAGDAATPAPLDIDAPDNANACPSCGHDGLPPLVCERCGHRWYANPAPLDVDEDWKALYDNAVEKVNALWFAAQPIIDAAIDIFPEEWIDPESSMAMPVTLRGRDVFALRGTLAATPAPLDVTSDDFRDRHERAMRDHILACNPEHCCDDLCSDEIITRLAGQEERL